MRTILVAVVAVAFVATSCSVDLTGNPTGSADALSNGGLPNSTAEPVAAVVRQSLPGVVNVTTDVFQPDQFGNVQQGKGVGTGFIVR